MADWSDIQPLIEQPVSRRQFLRLGGAVPLGLLTGAGGLVAGSILTPTEALARTEKHHQKVPHHKEHLHLGGHHQDSHHHSKDHHYQDHHHSKDHHHQSHHLSKSHHKDNYHKARQTRHYRERTLHLYNIHTDETVNTVYWAQGRYVAGGLRALNFLMRDHYTGDIVHIDPRLFDLLYALCGQVEYGRPFHILSGYRCPSTNAMLREQSDGVASHSLHMDGMAVDLRAPGLHTSYLRKAAMKMQYGGVGYYPDSDFVHVDTGPIRYW
ncbi:DUF882 domain-containing protein [Gammaproteobacteria bacterium]